MHLGFKFVIPILELAKEECEIENSMIVTISSSIWLVIYFEAACPII